MLDKIKEDLKKAITEFTIEDFNIYTMNELYMQIANKTNEVIEIVKLLQDYLDEQIFKDVENIEIKQQTLENIFNQLIINAGNSNAEIVDARVEADGTAYPKLGDRLNSIDTQIKDKANKNEFVKKGSGTLNDFNEETRRILQGMDSGQINAVLGKENVQNENIAFGAIEEYNLSDNFAKKILGKELFTTRSGIYENASSLLLVYTIPTTTVNQLDFTVKTKSLSYNSDTICIKSALGSEAENLMESEKIKFDNSVTLNESFNYSNIETTKVYIHIWVSAKNREESLKFVAYDFNLKINNSSITTSPNFTSYNLDNGIYTIEDYYIEPRIASYEDLNEIKTKLKGLTNITVDKVMSKLSSSFNYTLGTKRSSVSDLFYCNQHTFDEDVIISKIEMPLNVNKEGEPNIEYVIINKDMQILEVNTLKCNVTSTGTQNVTFDNLNINFPSGSYLGLRCLNNQVNFTYDDELNFRIRSINIRDTIASFDQDISGALNYTLHFIKFVSLEKQLDNLVAQSGKSRLYGKKIVAIGDSMVQGHSIAKDKGWLSMIANRNNMTFVNYGINGSYMTNKKYGTYKGVVDRFIEMDDDADYIIVFAGTNDAGESVVMGEDDSINPSEFKGALNIICDGLLTKYPTKRILFITPYLRNSNYINYINAIETICAKYGIRVFNNMKNGGICWQNNAQVQSLTLNDSYHLNLAGMEYVSYKYEEELKRL